MDLLNREYFFSVGHLLKIKFNFLTCISKNLYQFPMFTKRLMTLSLSLSLALINVEMDFIFFLLFSMSICSGLY